MDQDKVNHGRSRTIFLNFTYLTTGKILGDVLTFIFFVSLSRTFGLEGIGQYSMAMALAGFFAVIADFGLYFLSIKDMSRHPDSPAKYYGTILTVRIILTIIALALMLMLVAVIPYSAEFKAVIALVTLFQLIHVFSDGISTVFVAHEDMHLAGISEFILKALSSTAGIAAIFAGWDITATLATLPAVGLLHLAVVYRVLREKYWKPVTGCSLKTLLSELRRSIPYMSSELLRQISTRTDVVLLTIILSAASAGVYNAAYRIIFLLLFLPYFAGVAFFPVISKQYKTAKQKLLAVYHQAINMTVLAAVPVASGLWLIAPDLIILIYGEAFSESVSILRYLALAILFIFLNSIAGNFLTASDRQAERTRSQWFAATANIIGNIVLITLIGIKGAAISTLISEGLLFILYMGNLKILFGWPKISTRIIMSVVASLAFIIPFTLFKPLPLIIIIPASVLLYAGTLVLFKDFRNTELRLFLQILKTRHKDLVKEGQ